MIVECPKCDTTFSLPDEAYMAGRKARCSQCKKVFVLPELDEDGKIKREKEERGKKEDKDKIAQKVDPEAKDRDSDKGKAKDKDKDKDKAKNKKSTVRMILMLLGIAIMLAALAFGAYSLYKIFLVPSISQETVLNPELSQEEKLKLQELEKSVSRIALEDVRQFVVKNEKLGDIVVVHGRAVNSFDSPKELISVEVRLFDKEGRILAEKQQVAGVTLTRFQLSMLTEREFEEALNNKIDILTNNVNVPPGGSVPFVLIFSEVPANFDEFEVRPIAAKDPQ